MLTTELSALGPGRGEGGAPQAPRGYAAVVADVDHVVLPMVFAEPGVAIIFHGERSLLDARLFFASCPVGTR